MDIKKKIIIEQLHKVGYQVSETNNSLEIESKLIDKDALHLIMDLIAVTNYDVLIMGNLKVKIFV